MSAESAALLRAGVEDRVWIPVAEALPDDGVDVLVAKPGRAPCVCYREDGWHDSESGWLVHTPVTHWRHLPAPPAESGDAR